MAAPKISALRAILLRAINVGGNSLPMSRLRAFLEQSGLTDVQTLLQSGNAVARGGPADAVELERRLERQAAASLEMNLGIFVRSDRELGDLIDSNPFPKAAKTDPSRLIVYFVKDSIHAEDVRSLRSAIKGPETCECVGRHLYVVYPEGMGRSKLTSALVERVLDARGTARNWNTVLKLTALASKTERT